MFRGLFKKHEQDDDIFEVDPVVEQRRKEKFSTPLIYDEEFKEEVKESDEKPATKPKAKPKVNETKPVVEEKPKPVYQMSEVISPMNGIAKKIEPEKTVKTKKTIKPKKKKNSDQLVPVLSPYFGNYEKKTVVESEAKLTSINDEKEKKLTKEIEKLPTVEENLRNIAKIVEEEKDQLKIIEERTGEFKLDFNTNEIEKQNSLIDEIDDDMSLDELMSLYEKKFKD